MEKLLNVRFAQAVSVGGTMETYIDTTKGGKYELWLVDEFRIRIVNTKTDKTVYSSLFNATSWEFDEAYKAVRKLPRKKSAAQEFEDRELPLTGEGAN